MESHHRRLVWAYIECFLWAVVLLSSLGPKTWPIAEQCQLVCVACGWWWIGFRLFRIAKEELGYEEDT
jgi:hypothetical protein